MLEGCAERERTVHVTQKLHKPPNPCARTINIPMMEKINTPEKQSLHYIYKSKISHAVKYTTGREGILALRFF
jgi:hypothetical protein